MTLERFDQVEIIRNSRRFSKVTTNYLHSPRTGAQFKLVPTLESIGGVPWVHLTFVIPVAAVLAGHGLVHNGLEVIKHELKGVRKLVIWALRSYQFEKVEIDNYLAGVVALGCELTWHTQTSSLDAAKQAQARTIAHFTALQKIKSRHDAHVQKVEVVTSNGHTCLLVTFKDGSQFRQYIKAEQALSRTKNDRQACFVSKDMRKHLGGMLSAVGTHLRNEVMPSAKMLQDHGLTKFSDWNPAALGKVIDEVLTNARLDRRRIVRHQELDRSGLSQEVLATVDAYFAGTDLEKGMSPQLFSKHRSILLAKDVDIQLELGTGRNKITATGGLQLLYSKRWKPTFDLGELAVSSQNIGDIMKSLDNAPLADRNGPRFDQGEAE